MAIAEGSQEQDDAEITTAKEIVGAMNVLMSMLKNITIRPTAFASAVIAFMATHKLVIVLEKTDMADIEGGFKALRNTWVLDLATLTKRNAKWTKLSASVPSSFLSFLRTQLELAVVSLQDPAELGEAVKVGKRIVTGLKSVISLSVDEDLLHVGFNAAEVSSAISGAEGWERARADDCVRVGGPFPFLVFSFLFNSPTTCQHPPCNGADGRGKTSPDSRKEVLGQVQHLRLVCDQR